MVVSYTLIGPWRTRRNTVGRSPIRGPLVMCMVGIAALACASRSPLPRGAPPLAPASTPEPVRYEVTVPGERGEVQARLVRLLADSLFHVHPVGPASISAYNLARLVKVHVDLMPVGRDSVRVDLTGETYLGDTTRRDSISGLPERWRLITATDGASLVLRDLARSVWAMRPELRMAAEGEAPAPASLGLTDDREEDAQIAAVLAATPIGRAVEVCRRTAAPPGWLILYWYVDHSRCADLPDTRYPGEPNAMRIEREW